MYLSTIMIPFYLICCERAEKKSPIFSLLFHNISGKTGFIKNQECFMTVFILLRAVDVAS